MVNPIEITATVNGRSVSDTVEPRLTLADFLRNNLDLTGTHLGCEHGVCGACTVLLNDKSVRACLILAVQANGKSIATVEGLSDSGVISELQQAFQRHHGLQCGFCTPGMLTTAHALLKENSQPTREQIRDAISGNLCRCTGYIPIVDAIEDAARRLHRSATVPPNGLENKQ